MELNQIEEESEQIKATKPKRQLTQAQLDQLAKAREKANAVRKQNAEMKKKAQRLKELQKQVHEEELDEEIERYSAGQTKAPTKETQSKAKEKPKRNRRPPPAAESSEESSDEETSSSSEEEEPLPVRTRKPKKKKKNQYEPQYEPQYQPQYQPPVVQDAYAHQMNRAFGSLFPNYNM
jgi:hypothetical protein